MTIAPEHRFAFSQISCSNELATFVTFGDGYIRSVDYSKAGETALGFRCSPRALLALHWVETRVLCFLTNSHTDVGSYTEDGY